MSTFSESAGNGLTRCLVCNSIGCETWCPRHTLDLDESDGGKARRLRVCMEIVGLREIVEARDSEIAELNTQLENIDSVFAVLVRDIQDREILIPKLRKVVEAVRGMLARPDCGIRYQNDRIALDNALAELDTHDLDRSIDRDAKIYEALAKV